MVQKSLWSVISTRCARDRASHSHENVFIGCSDVDSAGLGCAWGSDSGVGVGVEVVVEAVVDGTFSFAATEGFCSS